MRNAGISFGASWPAFVSAFGFRLGLPLGLPSPTILVVLPRDGSEHVQHYPVYGGEHALGEVVPTGQHP